MIDARDSVMSQSASSASRRASRTKPGKPGKAVLNPLKATAKAGRSSGARRKNARLPIQHVFSDPNVDPFDQIQWERRIAEITDDSNKVIFKQEGVEVPAFWSQLATKVVCSKYFYGDPAKPEREQSVRQLIHRVTRTIADWGVADGYFSKEDGEIFYRELTWLCVNQYGAFNSPVWFNVGLYHQYGVGKNSGLGNWFYNRATGEAERAPTQYEYPQCSACFIQSVQDNMESIMNLAYAEAMLFKFGSGTGSDLTPIRSSREKLSGGGRPSGPLSFLKVYDQVANVVKSGGKTRRAAKMNTLRDWHGDIEDFITAKAREERKAWSLIEQGYDGSFNGEAYGSVMYQNENLSVRVSDEFMQAAIEGKEWWTRSITSGKPLEKKDASRLLDQIAEGTWICGDPGLQYDGPIQKWHTAKGTQPIHSTNPCSEYVFLNDTACNLASLNLMKFKQSDGSFDTNRFKAAIRIFITAQEILVDNACYPTKAIAENSHIFRTLGLGYANIGSLIMSYGLAYDSNEGRALAGAITAIMTGHSYEQSAEIAAIMGAFPGYADSRCTGVDVPLEKDNVASTLGVVRLHRNAVEDIQASEDFAYLKDEARRCWDRALARGHEVGYRNAQVTVLAPTGTIAFLMDCDTTGVEPDIALVKYKLLAGGGTLKIVNRTVPEALRRLGYSDSAVEGVVAHIARYDTIEDVVLTAEDEVVKQGRAQVGDTARSGLKAGHLEVFDCAFKPFRGQRSIHYMAHLGMMAACQPFISGAISKTVNLPNEATTQDIRDAYIQAWRMGLKCVAIYRDGSKRSQPLNTRKTNEGGDKSVPASDTIALLEGRIGELETELASLQQQVGQALRRRLPETRMALNHKFEIAGHEGYLTVGLFEDGRPGELFVTMAKEGSTIGGLMDTIGALTSMSLQYGVPLESLVKKFAHQRFEPSGFTRNPQIRNAASIIDYVFRWMGNQFLPGYLESNSPAGTQSEIALPGLFEELKKKVNRPVPELPLADEGQTEFLVKPVAPAQAAPASSTPTSVPAPRATTGAHFLTNMITGQADAPSCPNCGHITVRNGACYKCLNCGESLGCS
jgi:ribonucleoside-diphosphate reductase alpha chain